MVETLEQIYLWEAELKATGWWIKSIGKDHPDQENWWVMLFRKEYITRHGKGKTILEAVKNAMDKEEVDSAEWTRRRQNKMHGSKVKAKQRSEDVFNKLFDDLDNKE